MNRTNRAATLQQLQDAATALRLARDTNARTAEHLRSIGHVVTADQLDAAAALQDRDLAGILKEIAGRPPA